MDEPINIICLWLACDVWQVHAVASGSYQRKEKQKTFKKSNYEAEFSKEPSVNYEMRLGTPLE